ncbi:MAG: hypothetical protein II304_03850 [Bacteroidales bacterium]|nr:hypothetical protein [Bacteroidales bacterium]
MFRWILTLEGFNTQPKIYAETIEKAQSIFSSENILDIQPYTDMSYLKTIEELKKKSELIAKQHISNNRIREWYKCKLQDGSLRYRLYQDLNDNLYYDIAEYQFMSNGSLIYPITFTYSNPKDIYDLFFTSKLDCEIVSFRLYGQPKLKKPIELKGIKQSFSVEFIPQKCKCQCFVKDNDLWIKHRDFFSSCYQPSDLKDIGTPISYRLQKYFDVNKNYLDKFVYPDSWGEIVLRNEAWIVFRNIKQAVYKNKFYKLIPIVKKTFLNTSLLNKSGIDTLDDYWERFLENLCANYDKYIKEIK